MSSTLHVVSRPKDTHTPKDPLVVICGLNLIFKANSTALTALQDVSFAVQPAEMLCILGPSGCGKTTLLKVLAGFLKPTSGQVQVRGNLVTAPGPERCVVFQEDALFPWLTVAENIAFGLKGKGIGRRQRKEMVDHYLSLVGLTAFASYLPTEISGGMKQRVALARVLILEPEILLMDEPFAALDAQTRQEMQQLLLHLWETLSHTIVFVTHDVREAVTLADRVIMMDKNPGRVKKIVDIDLERPRDLDGQSFHRQCTRLHDLLRGT
jgi:NitT/TauT family transport system ATP-binding protein